MKALTPLLIFSSLLGSHLHAVEVANPAFDFIAGTADGDTTTAEGWSYLSADLADGSGTETELIWALNVGNGGNSGFGQGTTGAAGNFDLPAVVGSQVGTQYEIFTDGADDTGDANKYGGHGGIIGTDLLIHPSNSTGEDFLIIRYTLTADDLTNGSEMTISGSFRDLSGKNTVTNTNANQNASHEGSITAQVFYNSTQLWTATGANGALTQAAGTFNIAQSGAAEGDTISFVIDMNGNQSGDETALQASIDLGTAASNLPPSISIDPVSQGLFEGQPLNLNVAASGTAPFTYQWRKDMVDIAGATTASFAIASTVTGDSGSYDCVVTNAFGSATSMAAAVTVEIAPPTVVTQPLSQTLAIGQALNLSVIVEGGEPFTYQWAKDEGAGYVDIPGATDATFTIASVALSDAGSYHCFIQNSADEALSEPADIVVRANASPVANSLDKATAQNTALAIPLNTLATDADGDPLSLVAADASSAGGATIVFSETEVVYIPLPDSTITDDTFTCDVSDGFQAVTVTITVDVLPTSATVVANPAADYIDSATLPSNWSYFRASDASGGTEIPLEAGITGLANGGNTGFGNSEAATNNNFQVPAILGSQDGGAEFEIFSDGYGGTTDDLESGNRGLAGVDLLFHPGNNASSSFAIARYTLSADDLTHGSYAMIEGSFRELSGGTGGGGADSITAQIYLNDSEIFSVTGLNGRLLPSDGAFALHSPSSLSEGDTISFVVGRNTSYAGDEAALRALIKMTTSPPPFEDSSVRLATPDGTGANFVFTYTRAEDAPTSETHVFEYSQTLTPGSFVQIPIDTGESEVSLGTPAGGLQEVTITISKSSLADNTKLFGRLVVTPN